MGLTRDSNVKQLLESFNAGEIKYKDIMELFNVSRDLIKSRLKTVGLSYDQHEKKFIGEVTEDDLNMPLSQLFEKQRGNKSPKVSNSSDTSISDSQTNNASNSIINSNSEVAVTAEIQSLMKVKSKVDRVYKGIYFDSDIAMFLDSVPSGNRSEIINKILRSYLKDNGFLD